MGLKGFKYFILMLFISDFALGQEAEKPKSDSTKLKYQVDFNCIFTNRLEQMLRV